MMLFITFIGFDRTEGNIQTVLKRANNVSKFKDWLMTARCFSLDETEEDSFSIQTLAKIWHKTERNEWWRLAMNLIRCCSVKDVKSVHEFMKNVAKYNHSGKLLIHMKIKLGLSFHQFILQDSSLSVFATFNRCTI